jgi:hypothetical protein
VGRLTARPIFARAAIDSIKRELISFTFCSAQEEKLGCISIWLRPHTHNTEDEARGSHYNAADEKKMRKEEIDTHAIIVESTSLLVTALLFAQKRKGLTKALCRHSLLEPSQTKVCISYTGIQNFQI